MATGTVKFFDPKKGYGFIQPDKGDRNVFVHISAVERAGLTWLIAGQKVAYELIAESGDQGAVIGTASQGTKIGDVEPNLGGRAEGFFSAGTVKWFNPKKGYGFIQPDDGDEGLPMHILGERREEPEEPELLAAALKVLSQTEVRGGGKSSTTHSEPEDTQSAFGETELTGEAEKMLDDMIVGADKTIERIDRTLAYVQKVRAEIAAFRGDVVAS